MRGSRGEACVRTGPGWTSRPVPAKEEECREEGEEDNPRTRQRGPAGAVLVRRGWPLGSAIAGQKQVPPPGSSGVGLGKAMGVQAPFEGHGLAQL